METFIPSTICVGFLLTFVTGILEASGQTEIAWVFAILSGICAIVLGVSILYYRYRVKNPKNY